MWLRQIREEGRCLWLFLSLLSLLLLYPHLETGEAGSFLLVLLYTLVCLLAVWVSTTSRRRMLFAVATGFPMLLASWSSLFSSDPPYLVIFWASATVFFVVTTATLFGYVARSEEVTHDQIYGGISVYLLLGLTWFALYNLVEILAPGSFRGLSEVDGPFPIPSELLYYSFITLTTVGYGDITPVNSYARSLAMLEAISGVLFVATFVARLVSMYRPDDK